MGPARRRAYLVTRRPEKMLAGGRRLQWSHALTAYRRHWPGTPLKTWAPRSSNLMRAPATRSLTVLETRTSPGFAFPATRDPMWMAIPPIS